MWWPWLLLLLLLLAAAAWWLMSGRNGNQVAAGTVDSTAATQTTAPVAAVAPGDTTSRGAMATTPAAGDTTNAANAATVPGGANGAAASSNGANANAVNDFALFVATPPSVSDEAGEHQYTADGLRRLAAAIDAKSNGGGAASQTATIRAMADSLGTTSTANDRHAAMARTAFDSAAAAIRTMGASNAKAVESAAHAVKPSGHLLAQRAQVTRFFTQARDALQGSSTTSSTTKP